ncbi:MULTISPECIES: M48 family metalloprotease [Thermodesulfovibrio]|jgi:predicted Zn-dependent protease|uniref:M48 family metalloprotease n=1 Tax=Thermodesulfovibrio TaxID=28261 RepID=UPI002622A717|nr:M48 family metalloprotease [Thermodesulfovibrio sp.]
MKEKSIVIKIFSLFLTLIFALSNFSCAVNPVTGKQQLMFFSEEGELELGKNYFPSAIWGSEGGGGEYKDEKLRAYLDGIVQKLHKNSHRPHLPCKFYIQNSSIPNAWALPGYVAITRGLLAELDNEAEFAFVMGHEIGHVSARHSAAHMSSYVLMQVGLAILGLSLQGKEYSDLILGIGVIGGSLLLLKYSRDDELEADRLGVLYMSKIGYDPKYAISAHKTLERAVRDYRVSLGKDAEDDTFLGDLLSTHPRTRVRIEEIEKLIAESEIQPVKVDKANRTKFQSMVADLKRVNQIYRNYYDKAVNEFKKGNLAEAEQLLKIAIQKEKNQPSFYALYGFINYRNKNYQEAERYFRYTLNLQQDYQPALRGLGMISYRKNNYFESIGRLKKALSLFPEDINSMYYLGMSYYNLDNCAEAIDYLKKFSEARTNHQSVNGYLGVCYEKTGDLNLAYEAYKRQIEINSKNEIGKYALQRTNELKKLINKENEKQKKKK